ncbi:hypothetical protein [Streptomyces niveus]|uniref:hypothetical protein n=1 Tax=Streptomyces niveus TaxID=193462 RepID=UPI003657CDDB
MATAQYETRSRTVEETVIVLTLTEDEADELRAVIGASDGTRAMLRILRAMQAPEAPEAETPADTFEHEGVAYLLGGALYRDNEGDHVEFHPSGLAADGTPKARYRYGGPDCEAYDWTWSIGQAVREFGPLTKVTT